MSLGVSRADSLQRLPVAIARAKKTVLGFPEDEHTFAPQGAVEQEDQQ